VEESVINCNGSWGQLDSATRYLGQVTASPLWHGDIALTLMEVVGGGLLSDVVNTVISIPVLWYPIRAAAKSVIKGRAEKRGVKVSHARLQNAV
jgi:hypothetical protein